MLGVNLQGKKLSERKQKAIEKLIEPWYLFSLVWSVGATCDGSSRKKFDVFLRDKIKQENVSYVHTYVTSRTTIQTLWDGKECPDLISGVKWCLLACWNYIRPKQKCPDVHIPSRQERFLSV